MEMITLLNNLASFTGLCNNKEKSRLYFSKGSKQERSDQPCWILDGTLSVRYLGIPLSTYYIKARHYYVLLDKCRGKMEGWDANTVFCWQN